MINVPELKNRRGEFFLRYEWLNQKIKDINTSRFFLKHFFVVRCEVTYHNGYPAFKYSAYSTLFEEVPNSEKTPIYAIDLIDYDFKIIHVSNFKIIRVESEIEEFNLWKVKKGILYI